MATENPWRTNAPAGEDNISVDMPDLVADTTPGAGDGDRILASHFNEPRDKLQYVYEQVGTNPGNAPAGSLRERVATLEGGGGVDVKVKNTASDTTAGFLDGKLVVTNGLQKATLVPGGDEQLQVQPTYGSSANTVCQGNDSRLSDARTPTAHGLGGSEHSADTLANLNAKVSDATLDDSGDPRDPTSHALGSAAHSADTLANLNAKVSDATLDDSSGSRPPSGSASGQLSGSYPNPNVAGIRTTTGPTNLAIGAIADTQFLKRDGASIVGTSSTVSTHDLGGSDHNADTLANLNAKISDATLDDSSDTRDPNAHALGGAAHSADTLASLNAKVSDATLDDSSSTRDPNAHGLGGSAHSVDTLANLNSKVSDATLDDSSSSRPPSGSASGQLSGSYPSPNVAGIRTTDGPTNLTIGSITDGQYLIRTGSTVVGTSGTVAAHDLGGSNHNADTLANLNSKISDATLDDSSDTRDPNAHTLGGSAHSTDTLANLNSKVSDATLDDSSDSRPPSGSASGQLSGTYPSPNVAGIRTTTGPTNLTIGAVADGQFLKRDGSTLIGAAAGGSSPLTTKGDLYTFSTVNARLPVGSDGQELISDSEAATGVAWKTKDTKPFKGIWASVSTVTFEEMVGQSTTVRLTLQDGKQRYLDVSTPVTWNESNGVADLGYDEAGSQGNDKWKYFYAVPKSGDDDQLTIRASDNPPSTGPTGYTDWECVWATYDDGGDLVKIYQSIDRINYSTDRIPASISAISVQPLSSGALNPGAEFDISDTVPESAGSVVIQAMIQKHTTGTSNQFLELFIKGNTDTTTSGQTRSTSPESYFELRTSVATWDPAINELTIPVPISEGTPKKIGIRSFSNGTFSQWDMNIRVVGWIDEWIKG